MSTANLNFKPQTRNEYVANLGDTQAAKEIKARASKVQMGYGRESTL